MANTHQSENPTTPGAAGPVRSEGYRPDIDGMRAYAVLAVVLYHIGLGFPGGYIGVDVFFVISGYLISGHLLMEFARQKYSYLSFLERRCRRLLPAWSVVAVFTVTLSCLFQMPADLGRLGLILMTTALNLQNFAFWKTAGSGYFSDPPEVNPTLHTWSLAVEEQFYILYPLFLGLVYRLSGHRHGRIARILTAVAMLSFVFCVAGTQVRPIAAFFLLPTRAWELLLGGLTALAVVRIGSQGSQQGLLLWRNRWFLELVAGAGILAIAVPSLVYSDATPFPGVAAALPCLGTSCLILVGAAKPRSWVTRILCLRPLVGVGLVSYSLYLWHWPFLAFSKYCAAGEISLSGKLWLLVLSLMVSWLSWRFVEQPFRERAFCSRSTIFLGFALFSLSLFCVGLLLYRSGGWPGRGPRWASDRLVALSKDNYPFDDDVRSDDLVLGKATQLGVPGRNDFVVWGDCHAKQFAATFDGYAKAEGFGGYAITHAATAPLIPTGRQPAGRQDRWALSPEEWTKWSECAIDFVRQKNIHRVVLAAHWSGYDRQMLNEALPQTIRALKANGASVWVLKQIPDQTAFIPRAYFLWAMGKSGFRGISEVTYQEQNQELMAVLTGGCSSLDYNILDPSPCFVIRDQGQPFCRYATEEGILYRDSHHLSRLGSRVLFPLAAEVLRK